MWVNYINGNYKVLLNLKNGTKIRYNKDKFLIPNRPESIDVKITNQCEHMCLFCHEASIPSGKQASYESMEKFAKSLPPYIEIACLAGDTIVHSEYGAIEIDQLKIGDKIYDNEGILRTITNIQTSNKHAIELKGKKGFSVISSVDHPFIVNGVTKEAQTLLNQSIDEMDMIGQDQDQIYYIDMSKYIHEPSNVVNGGGSRGGRIIDDYTIRLTHGTSHIPRYVVLNSQLAWLYGLFVAEGSTRGLTLNIKEQDFADKAKKVWKDIFGLETSFRYNEDKNSMDVDFKEQSHIEALFVQAMQVGKGARNKSFRYMYHIQDKELVRQALLGLWQGDGCIRKRTSKNGYSQYSASLKTTSKYLAYDVAFLLAKWFGIKASTHHGMSKERKIENRILKASDYYSVEFYGLQKCIDVFPEYMQYDTYKKPIKRKSPMEITSITPTNNIEKLYDITLDAGTHIFPINGYVLTHNCGGGNLMLDFKHTQFFLEKLKEANAVPSITVKQEDFIKYSDIIEEWYLNNLIYGVGVSLSNPRDVELYKAMSYIPTAVIHVIAGIFNETDCAILSKRGYKLLILGFKDFRRGRSYYNGFKPKINKNIEWLRNNIDNILNNFSIVAFDNLAIEQLNIKEFLTEDQWKNFYMGDDGVYTFYVDLVEETYTKSSTSIARFGIKDFDVQQMFLDIYQF